MRRLWIALFAALCAVAMTACGAGNVPQGDVPAEEDREKGTVSGETAPEEERSRTCWNCFVGCRRRTRWCILTAP